LCSYDEGHGLPTEESSRIALRTQQVLAYETGVTRTIDPLAGSYYVEALTNRMEQEIRKGLDDVGARGGMARAIREGWLESQINTARYRNQDQIDNNERTLVGVNRFTIPREQEIPVKVHKLRADEWGAARTEYLRNYRASRDEPRWSDAVTRLEQAWCSGQNMVPAIMHALRNRATMGEINEAMRRAQGVPRR
jgi:methylmalonyl-CoA mutase N-terminal domain/subunit